MDLNTQYYGDFNANSVEGLELTMARKAVELQKTPLANPQGKTWVAIDVDENEEYANISFEGLEGNFSSDGKVIINNPFVDNSFTAGTGAGWPFNADNLLQAMVDVGMFLANEETDLSKQIGAEPIFVFSYSIASYGEVSSPHFTFDFSASEMPLILTPAGEVLATGVKSWLSGSV